MVGSPPPNCLSGLVGTLGVEGAPAAVLAGAGEVAVHLLNEKLTEATDEVLDNMSLEQLMEHVSRLTNMQQQMYYI